MRKQLYKEIETALLSILDDNDFQLIQYVDLWNNQVDDAEESEAFDTPAVFIEFKNIRWRTLGNKTQEGNTTLILHIVTKKNASTSNDSKFQDEELDALDIPDKIFTKLQNFKPTNASYMVRTDTDFNNNNKELQDTKETYEFTILNTLASPSRTQIGFTLNINRE